MKGIYFISKPIWTHLDTESFQLILRKQSRYLTVINNTSKPPPSPQLQRHNPKQIYLNVIAAVMFQDNWIEVLPQSSNVLQSAFSVAEKYMALIFMEDAKEIIQLYAIASGKAAKKRDLPVPAPGSIR